MNDFFDDAEIALWRDNLARYDRVQGMMTLLAGAATAVVGVHLRRSGIVGAMVEFGVFKGRSATLLASLAKAPDRLVLVDIHMHKELEALKALYPGVEIYNEASEKFAAGNPAARGLAGKCAIVHADGSHTFQNVANDLAICEDFVAEDAIVVLDDFQSPAYPQVQAAFFHHLFTTKSRLRAFMVGANKAFLTTEGAHGKWLTFAKTQFAGAVGQLGHAVQLSRTDDDPRYNVLTFWQKAANMTPIYKPEYYAKYFA